MESLQDSLGSVLPSSGLAWGGRESSLSRNKSCPDPGFPRRAPAPAEMAPWELRKRSRPPPTLFFTSSSWPAGFVHRMWELSAAPAPQFLSHCATSHPCALVPGQLSLQVGVPLQGQLSWVLLLNLFVLLFFVCSFVLVSACFPSFLFVSLLSLSLSLDLRVHPSPCFAVSHCLCHAGFSPSWPAFPVSPDVSALCAVHESLRSSVRKLSQWQGPEGA